MQAFYIFFEILLGSEQLQINKFLIVNLLYFIVDNQLFMNYTNEELNRCHISNNDVKARLKQR